MKTIEVSDETYEKIKDQIEADKKKEKPKFEPIEIHGGCFVVDVDIDNVTVRTGAPYNGTRCHQNAETVNEFIKALQSAIDFVEANKE